jgi:hypothetical protein
MERYLQKITRLTGIFFLILLLGFMLSCSKDDKEPVYEGKWVLEKTEPQLDNSYFKSYIHIKADKSFELYDSSKNLLVIGKPEHFSLNGIRLELTDPETNKKYLFTILSRKQDILRLRTLIFGPETELTMHKVSD